MINSVFDKSRVENVVGKGENTGYQHFLLFTLFSKAFFSGSFKVIIVWLRVKPPFARMPLIILAIFQAKLTVLS